MLKNVRQTLRYSGISLKESCFSYGYLYLAYFTIGNPKNLYIYSSTDKDHKWNS